METLLRRENIAYNDYRDIQSIPLHKGQIWYAELFGLGSVQKGIRPVVVFQNDMASKFSPTITIVALSSQVEKFMKKTQKTHSFINKNVGMPMDSVSICEQPRTIDKCQLVDYTGIVLDDNYLEDIKNGLLVQLGISLN